MSAAIFAFDQAQFAVAGNRTQMRYPLQQSCVGNEQG
jgi:hypothetical protein